VLIFTHIYENGSAQLRGPVHMLCAIMAYSQYIEASKLCKYMISQRRHMVLMVLSDTTCSSRDTDLVQCLNPRGSTEFGGTAPVLLNSKFRA
jgi:hypothetical protein